MAIPFAFPSDEDTDANYQRLDQLLADLFDVLQQILITQRRIRDAQPAQISPRVRHGPSLSSRRNGDERTPPSSFLPPDPPRLFGPGGPEARLPADFGRSPALQPASSSATAAVPAGHADLLMFDSPMAHARSPTRRRRRRRRTSSETSCCEETKSSNAVEIAATQSTTTQDWTQVGVNLRKIADDFYASVGKDEPQASEEGKRPCGVDAGRPDASLLSMLVPPPFGGSIWTAVIFVVGWRLLARAR